MNRLFSLVGRAGFEPATNGLKVRYAISAQRAFRGRTGAHEPQEVPFPPVFRQILPSCRAARQLRFTNAVQCYTACRKIQLVSTDDPGDNRARARTVRAKSHAFPALQWANGVIRGNAADLAFAFHRRCFDMALAGDVARDRYKLQRMMGRSVKSREIGEHPQSSPKARVAVKASRHVETPSKARSAALTQVRGRMSSAPFRKAMPLMTPAARPCAGTAANRQTTDHASGSRYERLEVRMHRLRRAVGPPWYFSGARLAETPCMSGVSGSALSEQIAARL